MSRFSRGLYSAEVESEYITQYLDTLDGIIVALAVFPERHEIPYLEERSLAKRASMLPPEERNRVFVGMVATNILAFLEFFIFSNVLRVKLILKALTASYNDKNYLAWTLLCRSAVEHCAAFSNYKGKLDQLKMERNGFSTAELQEIEKVLLEYIQGTRYDWKELLEGRDPGEPKKTFPMAVNVVTALKRLAKCHAGLEDVPRMYDLLSDLCHPNMGSHMLVTGVPAEGRRDVIVVAEVPEAPRGEFVMVATLPVLTACCQWTLQLASQLEEIREHWVDDIVGRRSGERE
jgi:hypothetical protein